MTKARFDLAQVAAAFLLPLVLIAVAGWFAWSETWERAEGELSRTADGAAEYAGRMFSSAVLAGQLANSLLSGASDEEIRQNEAEYHSRIAHIMPYVPLVNTITVSDQNGDLLLMSTEFPAPRISLADREWVVALQAPDPPPLHIGALSLGRVRGRLFFSVSIPRVGSGNASPAGAYDGLLNISVDPYKIALGLSTTTHEQADVISLIRSDGEILSTTRGLVAEIARIPPTSRLLAAIDAGETRGIYEGRALGLREGLPVGRGLSIAFRQVETLPVYVTVSRSPSVIIANWSQTMIGLLAVGLPTSLALGMLSLTAVRRRNALSASQAELAASFESAAVGTALVDGTSRRILKVNRRLCEMTGRDATALLGMTLDRLLGSGSSDAADQDDPASVLHPLHHPDGSIRWVECATAPVTRTRDNAPDLIIATLNDITERKESQERQALLAREVDHRAKNVLAIVQAVIRLAREPTSAEFADKIEGRIKALARAHELLAKDRWQGADLMDLIRDELVPYQDGARITISGSAVHIAPTAVQPLSMAVHELAKNAVKHGALGTADGSLSISWALASLDGPFQLLWEEQGGKGAKRDPDSRGAGLKILQGSVAQCGGTVDLDWRTAGLFCRIEMPVDFLAIGHDAVAGERASPAKGDMPDGPRSLSGMRVLLVEDEALLALDIQEMLQDLGCRVIGPASTVAAAWALARQEAGCLDAAILDVNVKGATTFDLARQLHSDGTACIFVTGYSKVPEAGEEDWVLLRKPVSTQEITAALQKAIGSAAAESEHSLRSRA